VDRSLAWRAALLQTVAVAAVFVLLLVAPLPAGFFRENGAIVGPLAWVVCSLLTGVLMSLRLGLTLGAAFASGVVAGAVGMLLNHTAGLVLGILAFGAVAGYLGRGRHAEAAPTAVGTR
jgi:hypothetical protein